MALTPELRASQGQTLAVVEAVTPELKASQVSALAVFNFPTEQARVSSLQITGTVDTQVDLRASQVQVLAVVRGRIDSYRLRAWTFSLDGHDFYVLTLGQMGTLVYDMHSRQWSEWTSDELAWWKAGPGLNWLGMKKTTFDRSEEYKTNIVAGDDASGQLWILDPTQGFDDDLQGTVEVPINRELMGQVPMRRRQIMNCYEVYLTASLAQPAISGAAVTLETSDDSGATWLNHGAITITSGDNSQELGWLSLGEITAPGRLFRLTDNGAALRIDGLDMNDE